jgi:hypothetical protein
MNQAWLQGTPRRGFSPRSDGSFRRPAEPAYWLFLVMVVGSAFAVGSQQLAYIAAYHGAWLLSVILLAITAIPAAVLIYRFDQFEPEPVSMILAAVLWGGLVAITFAGLTNNYFLGLLQNVMPPNAFQGWGAAIVAPIDEELYKGVGLVILYLIARDEIDGLMDGLVYGAMIGLGFQTVENIQYFVHAAANSHAGQVTPVLSTYVLRVVISGLVHGTHRFRLRLLRDTRGQVAEDPFRCGCAVRGSGGDGALRLGLAYPRFCGRSEFREHRSRSRAQGPAVPHAHGHPGSVRAPPRESGF